MNRFVNMVVKAVMSATTVRTVTRVTECRRTVSRAAAVRAATRERNEMHAATAGTERSDSSAARQLMLGTASNRMEEGRAVRAAVE